MPFVRSSNLKPICVLNVLEKYSDAEHHLTQGDICRLVGNEHGISMERKAVGRTIKALRDELEIEILSDRTGVWLNARGIDDNDLSLIVDSIMSNRNISYKHSKELTESLKEKLSSRYFKSFSTISPASEEKTETEVTWFLEVLNEAIRDRKCVSFSYTDRGKESPEQISGFSPAHILNEKGRYYVLGLPGKPAVKKDGKLPVPDAYELDRIRAVTTEDETPYIPVDDKYLQESGIRELKSLADIVERKDPYYLPMLIKFYAPSYLTENIYSRLGNGVHIRRCIEKDLEIMTLPADGPMIAVSVVTEWSFFVKFMKRHFNEIEVHTSRPEEYEKKVAAQMKAAAEMYL